MSERSGRGGSRTDDAGENWAEVVRALRGGAPLPSGELEAVFGPLRRGGVDELMVVGQCGQSIDGRVATATGHSKYVNGEVGLRHLHRLRSLVDAVVIGIGTALADDPQLTVRRVAGPNPARIVIDPRGRLPTTARVLATDGVSRLVVRGESAAASPLNGAESVSLPAAAGHIAPADILAVLAARGWRRILVEGGPQTVSRFLAAGCLDRLHVVVAPIIIGAGPAGVALPPIASIEQALHARMHMHDLGGETLLDCDLSAHRVAVGAAKKST